LASPETTHAPQISLHSADPLWSAPPPSPPATNRAPLHRAPPPSLRGTSRSSIHEHFPANATAAAPPAPRCSNATSVDETRGAPSPETSPPTARCRSAGPPGQVPRSQSRTPPTAAVKSPPRERLSVRALCALHELSARGAAHAQNSVAAPRSSAH